MDPTAHQTIDLNAGADLTGFRRVVRMLTLCSIPPRQVTFRINDGSALFGSQDSAAYGAAGKPIILPRAVTEMIKLIVCHSDPEKYAWLYELAWRVTNDKKEKHLLEAKGDDLVHRLDDMAQSVRRDIHRMQTSLRFRQMDDQGGEEHFAAWFEPEHYIVEAAAQVFVDRFTSMVWTILTPKGSLHWDKKELWFGPPTVRRYAPGADVFESGWRTYSESTFNPARTNLQVRRQLLPETYWKNMPETQAIPHLVSIAAARLEEMIVWQTAMPAERSPHKAAPVEGQVVSEEAT
ncbi:MAG: TIGR03915 family putative DNA repair protein [Hyphomonadaceae bacterium]|nr:TIGR03915 family putative DNA repair protein [Hyphomonadaceae bacterium]